MVCNKGPREALLNFIADMGSKHPSFRFIACIDHDSMDCPLAAAIGTVEELEELLGYIMAALDEIKEEE